jgi:hypothetical protein
VTEVLLQGLQVEHGQICSAFPLAKIKHDWNQISLSTQLLLLTTK